MNNAANNVAKIVGLYSDAIITGTEMTSRLLSEQAKAVELYRDGIITVNEMTDAIVAVKDAFELVIGRKAA